MGVDAIMFVKPSIPLTSSQVRRLAANLHEDFPDAVWVSRPSRHCVSVETENDYNIPVGPDRQLLQVHLHGRYYGLGYERGHLPDYLAIADWLEVNLPGCTVYYGGDSHNTITPWLLPDREALFRHFATHHHDPYVGYLCEADSAHHCDFCDRDMNQHQFICHGCGYEKETRDGGKTWKEKNQ